MTATGILRPARLLATLAAVVAAPDLPAADRPVAHHFRLLGWHALEGRGAYQPVIQRQGDRWIAYVGHHAGRARNPLTGRIEPNGTSVLDVTDPGAPRLVAHIAGPVGGAQMARTCSGARLASRDAARIYLLRTRGHEAHEVWDVSVPERPQFVATVVDGLRDTHKNWWECDTGIAYLVSGAPGWRTTRMTQVYDLSDPARPRHLRDFGLPGQEPGASGPVPTGLHGAISTGPQGNRVYFGHGVDHDGVLQIVDRRALLEGPREATAAHLRAPQVARFDLPRDYGAHTALPVRGLSTPAGRRDVVFVVNEAVAAGCAGARQKVWVIDVTDERTPAAIGNFDVPEGDFCRRGLRFGAHASNEHQPPVFARRVLFFAWFAAGVRAVDIRDPARPREIAHFVPGGRALTNNVEVDDRGHVYIVDRAGGGMHILALDDAVLRAIR